MNRWRGLSLAAILVAGMAGSGCDSVADSVSVDPAEVVAVSANPTAAPADGDTRVQVTVQIPAALNVNPRTITLSTNLGLFVSSGTSASAMTLEPDSSGFAYATLEAPTRSGIASVQARVSTFGSTTQVDFQRVGPLRIDVDPGGGSVSGTSAGSTNVTARLVRGTGVASEETPVAFTARDSGGQSIGLFSAITASDASGNATAKFSPGKTQYRGRVVIEARAGGVTGSAPIDIVD